MKWKILKYSILTVFFGTKGSNKILTGTLKVGYAVKTLFLCQFTLNSNTLSSTYVLEIL